MAELLILNQVERAIQAVRQTPEGPRARTLVGDVNETPDGIVVDNRRRHIYWANMGTPDPGAAPGTEPTFYTCNGSMERVDFDGADRRRILERGSFTTGKQLTADFGEGKLYWCDREGMQVLRADLAGSNLEALIVAGAGDDAAHDARNHCVGVAVDAGQRKVYWSQKGPSNGNATQLAFALCCQPSRISMVIAVV